MLQHPPGIGATMGAINDSAWCKECDMTAAGSGVPEIDLALCTRCGDCVDACPSGALSMTAEGELALDLERCAYCADCEDVCPVGAISLPFDIVIGHHHKQGDEQ